MKKSLIAIAVFMLILTGTAEQILEIDVDIYKNDSVSLNTMRVIESAPSIYIEPGDYKIEILNAAGEKIFEQQYRLLFMILSDPPTETDYDTVYLKTNYVPEMRKVKIYDKDTEIFSHDIELCNSDGVCDEAYETIFNCPNDCSPEKKESICNSDADGVCDPNCAEGVDPDCVTATTTTINETLIDKINTQNILLPAILVILLVLIVVELSIKLKKKKDNST